MFTEGQEKVFRIIDEIIDGLPDDSDITIESICSQDANLRQRILRNFPGHDGYSSIQVALISYGFSDSKYLPGDFPSDAELLELLYIEKGTYKVKFRNDLIERVSQERFRTVGEIIREVRRVRDAIEIDAISLYVEETSPEEVYWSKMPVYITKYIDKHFKSYAEFRTYFNVDYRLADNYCRGFIQEMISSGRHFENKVGECLTEAGILHRPQVIIGDCRPDFVLEGEWIDAKLSKSTVFASDTIDKYTKHTDALTIIYAIDDMPDNDVPELPGGVRLVHVLDYFPDADEELKGELLAFIDHVTARKGENRAKNWRNGDDKTRTLHYN